MINNKKKGRLRLSLRRGRIYSQIDIIITSRKGILQINQGLPILKLLVQCSESQCIIKNESFFKRPNKMMGNLEKRNHNLYCQYHQDHGHTTEDCRSLWDHLDQLV